MRNRPSDRAEVGRGRGVALVTRNDYSTRLHWETASRRGGPRKDRFADTRRLARRTWTCETGGVTGFLKALFVEAELTPDEAERAAQEAWSRITGPPPQSEGLGGETVLGSWAWETPRSFREALVSRPEGSLARILSVDEGLPFLDASSGQLSVVGLAELFATVGVDPVVAMACARVVVELQSPESFYAPAWRALGREEPIDLADLADAARSGKLKVSQTRAGGSARESPRGS